MTKRWQGTSFTMLIVVRVLERKEAAQMKFYGSANLTEVLREFEHDPVTVDGEVPVQIWCNNFIDTLADGQHGML